MKKEYLDPRMKKRIAWKTCWHRFLALAILGILGVCRFYFQVISSELALTLLGSLGFSVILAHIFHVFGHWAAGLYSEYYFLSLRLGSFTLTVDEEARFGVSMKKTPHYDKWAECIMTPNEEEEYGEIPVHYYLLGGGVANLASLPLACLFLLISLEYWYIVAIFVAVSLYFALTSLIPIHFKGLTNDAYIHKLCKKDPHNLAALVSYLRIMGAYGEGHSLGEMSETWFYGKFVMSDKMTSNPLIANLWRYTADRFVVQEELFQGKIIYEALSTQNTLSATAQRNAVYLQLNTMLLEGRVEEVRIYPLPKWMQKTAKKLQKHHPLYCRYRYAHAMFVSERGKIRKEAGEHFEKILEKYPYEGKVQDEHRLLEALDTVEVLEKR